jgi:hypothetical protein
LRRQLTTAIAIKAEGVSRARDREPPRGSHTGTIVLDVRESVLGGSKGESVLPDLLRTTSGIGQRFDRLGGASHRRDIRVHDDSLETNVNCLLATVVVSRGTRLAARGLGTLARTALKDVPNAPGLANVDGSIRCHTFDGKPAKMVARRLPPSDAEGLHRVDSGGKTRKPLGAGSRRRLAGFWRAFQLGPPGHAQRRTEGHRDDEEA